MSVNFSAAFTKATRQYNGFTDPEIEPKISDPNIEQEPYICVSIVRRKFLKNDDLNGTRTPTMMTEHIEVVRGQDAQVLVKQILKGRLQERTGLTGEQEPDPTLFDAAPDGERQVPEADGEELTAQLDERRAKREQGEG